MERFSTNLLLFTGGAAASFTVTLRAFTDGGTVWVYLVAGLIAGLSLISIIVRLAVLRLAELRTQSALPMNNGPLDEVQRTVDRLASEYLRNAVRVTQGEGAGNGK